MRRIERQRKKGMFGTLVINLPSPHPGGTLIVSHNGKKEETSSNTHDKFPNSRDFLLRQLTRCAVSLSSTLFRSCLLNATTMENYLELL